MFLTYDFYYVDNPEFHYPGLYGISERKKQVINSFFVLRESVDVDDFFSQNSNIYNALLILTFSLTRSVIDSYF